MLHQNNLVSMATMKCRSARALEHNFLYIYILRTFSFSNMSLCLGRPLSFLTFLHPSACSSLTHLFCLHQCCYSPALRGQSEGRGRELLLQECRNDPLSLSCRTIKTGEQKKKGLLCNWGGGIRLQRLSGMVDTGFTLWFSSENNGI